MFVEQRYYGKSLPYGDSTFTPEHMGFLTAEQALADYAVLISRLRAQYSITKVISFGGRLETLYIYGYTANAKAAFRVIIVPLFACSSLLLYSYGGMLSAWFRFKYPNMVYGALAASAPIYIVANLTSPYAFFGLVTQV